MPRSDVPATTESRAVRAPQARGLRSAKKLLDAAASLFLEKGFDETTVDEIALRAGTGKGTFYHHYESKAALLHALQQQVIADFEAYIGAAVERCPTDDLRRQLDAWVQAACEAYVNLGPMYDVVWGREYPRWTSANTKYMGHLVALLKKGHAQGLWTVRNPQLTATLLFRGLVATIDEQILAGKLKQAFFPELVKLVRHLVRVN